MPKKSADRTPMKTFKQGGSTAAKAAQNRRENAKSSADLKKKFAQKLSKPQEKKK